MVLLCVPVRGSALTPANTILSACKCFLHGIALALVRVKPRTESSADEISGASGPFSEMCEMEVVEILASFFDARFSKIYVALFVGTRFVYNFASDILLFVLNVPPVEWVLRVWKQSERHMT